jgi:hypothetical protein
VSLNIPMKKMLLPENGRVKSLLGFDYGNDIYHVLVFDFGDDGGAIGICREGDNFCARISLDSLAEFHQQSKAEHTQGIA